MVCPSVCLSVCLSACVAQYMLPHSTTLYTIHSNPNPNPNPNPNLLSNPIPSETLTVPSNLVGVNVFSSILHMHLTGKRIWTRLWRNGSPLLDPATGTDALGHTDSYDYNFQHFDSRDLVFQEGDQLSTTCIYENTVQRGIEYGNSAAAAGQTVRSRRSSLHSSSRSSRSSSSSSSSSSVQ